METNYQIIVDLLANMMLVSFPIALIFMIAQKLTGIVIAFFFGKEVNF